MTPSRTRVRRRAPGRGVGWVLLAVGLALLGGAAYAYESMVRRPLSWPTADAEVVSSRVVNPRKPTQYQAEIVLDIRDAAAPRRVPIVPSWSSSSYDTVRAYVDAYPAGTRLAVAVNPADRGDVRFELGATFTNLLLPGILGLLGAIFALVGGAVARRRPDANPPDAGSLDAGAPAAPVHLRRRIGYAFAAIGVGACGLGAWLWSLGTPLDWPEVDAMVVESRVIQARSTRRASQPSRPRYDIQVTFAYAVGEARFSSTTTSGDGTPARDAAERRLAEYAPGSRHRIRHRPGDPNVIRFELSPIRERLLPVGLGAMGLVFLAFAIPLSRSAPRP